MPNLARRGPFGVRWQTQWDTALIWDCATSRQSAMGLLRYAKAPSPCGADISRSAGQSKREQCRGSNTLED